MMCHEKCSNGPPCPPCPEGLEAGWCQDEDERQDTDDCLRPDGTERFPGCSLNGENEDEGEEENNEGEEEEDASADEDDESSEDEETGEQTEPSVPIFG